MLKSILVSIALASFGLPGSAQSKETVARFRSEAHIGSAEEALVGVTITFRGKSNEVLEIRHATGFLLRCDGFVLFPAAHLEHRADEPADIRPDLEITVRPDDKPMRKAVRWPRHIPRCAFRMVKAAEVHAPALRTLSPEALKEGDPLTIAWRPWNTLRGEFGPMETRNVKYAGPVRDKKRPDRCLLDGAVPGAPAGAVVVGPDNMAVGMLTEGGAVEFLAMSALPSVTNCVVPAPITDSQFAALSRGGGKLEGASAKVADDAQPSDAAAGASALDTPKPTEMAHIAGGPAPLPDTVLEGQDEMMGAQTACVPPFDIDRTEVTNDQYWSFWSRLPDKTAEQTRIKALCRPLGWASAGPPYPQELGSVPVLGVTYTGAQTYARSVGKRLPTPYEWCAAALGMDGTSKPPPALAQYVADRRAAALRIKQAHLKFLRDQADSIHVDDFISPLSEVVMRVVRKIRNIPVFDRIDGRIHQFDMNPSLPWTVAAEWNWNLVDIETNAEFYNSASFRLDDRLEMQRVSQEAMLAEVNAVWNRWRSPGHVLAGGSRSFDVTPAGVNDLLFNSHEYVAAPPFGRDAESGYTLYVNWVPDTSREIQNDRLIAPMTSHTSDALTLSRIVSAPSSARMARWIQIGLNIAEARQLAGVLSGWRYEFGPEPLRVVHPANEAFLYQAAAYVVEPPYWLHTIWAGKSSRSVVEVGSQADIARLAELPREGGILAAPFGALVSLRPVGFRCAR